MRPKRWMTYIVALATAWSVMKAETRSMPQAIFDPTYKTLLVYPEQRRYESPVIHGLESDEQIVITFDRLSDQRNYLRYELIHCDEEWRPEQLTPSELTQGFNEGIIEDVAHSQGTVSQYVNYRMKIPNEDVRPLISGNWIVRVYDEEMPDQTVLQARFMIAENEAMITAKASGRTDVDFNQGHQQLEIEADTRRSNVRDIAGDLKLVISQNGRSDNSVTLTTPGRIEGHKAIYAHDGKLIFDAGNEYRRFESVSTTYPGMHVEYIGARNDEYICQLMTDLPRTESPYEYDSTQHGRYTIAADDSENPDTEAEYVVTLFTLKMPELRGKSVHIEGELTGRNHDDRSKMSYNRDRQQYELALKLKQGSYNYQYVTVSDSDGSVDTRLTEGNDYRTINEYGVGVYYRHPGDRHTRLLGYRTFYNQ